MATVNTEPAAITHLAASPHAQPRPRRRGAILVVEDRYDVRQGMAQLLELHGFLVVDAAGGEEAYAHLSADPQGFALILLDLVMPGPLTGTGLRTRQLGDAELADIPAVVVSATEPDPALVQQLHPQAWLAKPFRFDDLLSVVRQYVTPEAGAIIDVGRQGLG